MPNWKPAKIKKYYNRFYKTTIDVDAGMDIKVLDKLNSFKDIIIIATCEGHDYPTEPDATDSRAYIAFVINTNKVKGIRIPKSQYMKIEKESGLNPSQTDITIRYTQKGKAPIEWWYKVISIIQNIINQTKTRGNIPDFLNY